MHSFFAKQVSRDLESKETNMLSDIVLLADVMLMASLNSILYL